MNEPHLKQSRAPTHAEGGGGEEFGSVIAAVDFIFVGMLLLLMLLLLSFVLSVSVSYYYHQYLDFYHYH